MEYENVVKNDHIFTESRTCQRIASEHGVGEKTVRRAEKYSQGIDAAGFGGGQGVLAQQRQQLGRPALRQLRDDLLS